MPVTINWGTKVISIPQSYLTPLGGIIYELDVNQLRLDLKDLEDGEDGIVFPRTHNHNTTVTLSGVTYARTFEIINGYTVDFVDDVGPEEFYLVQCTGANHNIADVIANVHRHFALVVNNAAGLIQTQGPTLVDANILSIDGSTTVPALMRIASETMLIGTVATVISNSELEVTFSSFTTEETANLQGRRLVFTSGARKHEAARITAYDGQGANPAKLTVTSLSGLPTIGDTLVIV